MADRPTIKQYVTTGFNVFETSKPLSKEEVEQLRKEDTFASLVKIGATELVLNNPSLDYDLCCDMLRVYLFYVREYNGVH